jgi:hypothetical protein
MIQIMVKKSELAALDRRNFNQRKAPRIPGITAEEYFRCRAEQLCLKCKKPGHIARNCNSNNFQSKKD